MLRLSARAARRAYTTAANAQEGWIYVDSIFPIQLAAWDLRHYIGILRQEHLLTVLESRLDQLSNVCDFKALELQPQMKDGGVFVRFSYTPEALSPGPDPMTSLQQALRDELAKVGTLPTWNGIGTGDIWVDMNRFASPVLKVAFEGPDVQEQSLYELCRPYGRIKDLALVPTVPAGTLRFSTVTFKHVHSAAIARNVIHGFKYPLPSSEPSSQTKTRLRVDFQKPLQAHAVRDWISGHPKIVLPVIVFLLGSLTYTVFDPIRSLMVEAKMLDWLDYRKFRLYQWLQVHALEPFAPNDKKAKSANIVIDGEIWKDRQDAAVALQSYLSDSPSTVAFVHGPQGSGKTSMLEAVLHESKRNTLTIDCRQLQAASSDSALVGALAAQTGYWPVFNFLSSMSSLVDLASVGLIGQKAGMSSSLTEQLHKILDVVTEGLRGVSSSHKAAIQKRVAHEEAEEQRRVQDEHRRQAIIDGRWHDARLDCVAGNGVMSELGVGDEMFGDEMVVQQQNQERAEKNMTIEESKAKKKHMLEDEQAIQSLPVVIIRNYAANSREDVMDVLAQWAASLAENHIAHVIVLSDNRENAKRLTKALPTKPLSSIALSDADAGSSLSFVKQKLLDAGLEVQLTSKDAQFVERLGGRASDLESLIHKVRTGMKIEEAVEDIITRGVVELRKNTFGEDAEESKNLPWTRYQAWKVLKVLAKSPEVGYYDMLVDFPFKGDENALRAMEHAELITIVAKNGRPSGIRPGKPVFRWVFERVVNDKVFQATQELAYNEKQVSDTETKIQGYEQELKLLVDMMQNEHRPWYSFRRSPCLDRARSVGEKLVVAERKVSTLERKIVELKKVLAGST
ncbi:hypothetical protein D9619_005680 [Psilocybe cf. subviscida]|uniref:Mitochondrial escape protein 2 n=1 Tax=Psilocybe cf. subviscida TaxID=2480587 RepID=A0A8H5FBN5_9AGAR|nr:hypothetical protein D9619_005680 [Psilocybe cf. subviscida]